MSDITPEPDSYLSDQLTEVFKYHQAGNYQKAESLYQHLILRYADIWQLYFNFGLLLYELRRYDEALEAYRKGLAINDSSNDLFYNTAICHKELGHINAAIESYQKALALVPEDIDSRYNLAGCYRAIGDDRQAALTYKAILDFNPTHISSLNNLAYLCHKNGDNKRAEDLYSRILKLNPNHVFADHMLAALTGRQRDNTPDSYIRDVFDQFSDHYESSLTEKLHYNLPSKLFDFCQRVLEKKRFDHMLDLGCGSGLVGELFSPVCSFMTGVDISDKMTEIAHRKQLYESLYVSEIISFLKIYDTVPFDLIISADVFPYIGDLSELFNEAGKVISNDGSFLFSVEHFDGDDNNNGPQLRHSGRFAHSRLYVSETAAKTGWHITASDRLDLRMEKDEWVQGCVYAMSRIAT